MTFKMFIVDPARDIERKRDRKRRLFVTDKCHSQTAATRLIVSNYRRRAAKSPNRPQGFVALFKMECTCGIIIAAVILGALSRRAMGNAKIDTAGADRFSVRVVTAKRSYGYANVERCVLRRDDTKRDRRTPAVAVAPFVRSFVRSQLLFAVNKHNGFERNGKTEAPHTFLKRISVVAHSREALLHTYL